MTPTRNAAQRILSIDVCHRGVGFVVLESPSRLVDWGVKRAANGQDNKAVAAVSGLLKVYQPDGLVLDDCLAPGSRRGARTRRLFHQFTALAKTQHVAVYPYPAAQVKRVFATMGALNKQQRAASVALQLPVLVRHLPPLRKIWMSEDPRMSLFDAAALALMHVQRGEASPSDHNLPFHS